MINYNASEQEEMLIAMVQPKKIVEHFGGEINEIKRWADMSTKEDLLISIKAFQREGLQQYTDVLLESLNSK